MTALPYFFPLLLLLLLLPLELELVLELEPEPELDPEPEPDELDPDPEELLDAGALMVMVGRKMGMMGVFLRGCDILIFDRSVGLGRDFYVLQSAGKRGKVSAVVRSMMGNPVGGLQESRCLLDLLCAMPFAVLVLGRGMDVCS